MPNVPSVEPRVIAAVRVNMHELERLALGYGEVAFRQAEAHAQNPQAAGEAGAFTILAEQRTQLQQEYAAIKAEVQVQIRLHDTYCMQQEQDFSDAWIALLQELQAYLDTANTLGNVLMARKSQARL